MHALYKPIQHFCLITFENINLGYNAVQTADDFNLDKNKDV